MVSFHLQYGKYCFSLFCNTGHNQLTLKYDCQTLPGHPRIRRNACRHRAPDGLQAVFRRTIKVRSPHLSEYKLLLRGKGRRPRFAPHARGEAEPAGQQHGCHPAPRHPRIQRMERGPARRPFRCQSFSGYPGSHIVPQQRGHRLILGPRAAQARGVDDSRRGPRHLPDRHQGPDLLVAGGGAHPRPPLGPYRRVLRRGPLPLGCDGLGIRPRPYGR